MGDMTERIKEMTAHTYGTWNRQKAWSTPLLKATQTSGRSNPWA